MADQFSQVVPHEPTTAQRVSYFIHAVAAVAAPVCMCRCCCCLIVVSLARSLTERYACV